MRALLLCNLVPGKRGAFESFVTALGRVWRNRGHELAVVVAGPPIAAVAEEWADAGVTWTVVPVWNRADGTPNPWAIVLPAWRFIRGWRPDVVAVHFGNELPTIALAAMSGMTPGHRIRWFWHQHQQVAMPRTFAQRHTSRIRALSFAVEAVVVLYEGGRAALRSRGVPDSQCRVILNGTPGPVLRRSAGWLRSALGVSPDALLVANVSSLIPRKRVDVTLDAFAAAIRNLKRPSGLVLVGTGPEEQRLREQAARLGIGDRVTFMGRRDDVSDLVAEVDIVCLSSAAEACPYALLEAMALGRPCVATDAGAASEIIADGVTGWVVPVGNVATLASRLTELLRDRDRRLAYGLAGKHRWASWFTLDRQVETVTALYEGGTLASHGTRDCRL